MKYLDLAGNSVAWSRALIKDEGKQTPTFEYVELLRHAELLLRPQNQIVKRSTLKKSW